MSTAAEIQDQQRLLNEEMPQCLDHPPDTSLVVLKAMRSWQHMYDILSNRVERVELVHPQKAKAIA